MNKNAQNAQQLELIRSRFPAEIDGERAAYQALDAAQDYRDALRKMTFEPVDTRVLTRIDGQLIRFSSVDRMAEWLVEKFYEDDSI